MITLYHGSNMRTANVDLNQCKPYKDFGQAFYLTADEQEFKYMVEGVTSDLIQLLMERNQYALPRAIVTVYSSNTYRALLRLQSNLYFQSTGYLYSLLSDEIVGNNIRPDRLWHT